MSGPRALRAAMCITIWAVPGTTQDAHQPSSRLPALPLDAPSKQSLQSALLRHDYAFAENLLAAEARRNPASQPLLLVLADTLFLDGKQLNAVVVLKKAELLGPLDEPSRLLLALSYVSLKRSALAASELHALAQSHPSNAVYPYWLSRLAHKQMNYANALVYAQRAVALQPSFVKAMDQLGLCYSALGRNEEAIRAYRDAIRLGREQSLHWPWAALNLGTLYVRLGQYPEAETVLRESIALEPQLPAAHFRLGQVLLKTARVDEAVRELQRAVLLDSTYPDPHYLIARIYREQGDLHSMARELATFKSLKDADTRKGVTRPN